MPGMEARKVVVINPGGTSTKVAYYEDDREIFSTDVRHPPEDLEQFGGVFEQHEFRLDTVRRLLDDRGVDTAGLDAVVGRGGPVAPVISGTYAVDEAMLSAIREGRVMVEHPSLLGAPLAHDIARDSGCGAYIVDPVSVDEFTDEARVTGLPQIPRRALSHALSVKAAAREAARRLGRPIEELNMVIMHLGSGITIAASMRGRQIDSTDASASGPMAPTRTGSLPALDLARLCFDGDHTLEQMKKLLVGKGGWMAHLGTDDVREIYARIDGGDARAATVLDATLMQIAKEAAAMTAVLEGQVDALVITGGIARSERFAKTLLSKIKWLSPAAFVLPGENEMLALALGAIRALDGECEALSMAPFIERFQKERS